MAHGVAGHIVAVNRMILRLLETIANSADGKRDGAPPSQDAHESPRSGDSVLNKSLTIVLPVYNAESRLRNNVQELLDLASELTPQFTVLIIDDGSTDATFEVAEELAAIYPQLTVRRHRVRRGLGASIQYAERCIRSDVILVHDGVSPIDSRQLHRAWNHWLMRQSDFNATVAAHDDLRELLGLSSLHANLNDAHRRILGFQLITPTEATSSLSEGSSEDNTTLIRHDVAHGSVACGIGQIPSLPRRRLVSVLIEFAKAE